MQENRHQVVGLLAARSIAAILLVAAVIPTADAGQKRSTKAKTEFKQLHPCPSTGHPKGACPGWIIDHVTALACGGYDRPENMQWQTVEDAKAKDKWERLDCNN